MAENDAPATAPAGPNTDREYLDRQFKELRNMFEDIQYSLTNHNNEKWTLIEPFLQTFEYIMAYNRDVFSKSKEEKIKTAAEEVINLFKNTLETCGVVFESAVKGEQYNPDLQEVVFETECPLDVEPNTVEDILGPYSYRFGNKVKKQSISIYR